MTMKILRSDKWWLCGFEHGLVAYRMKSSNQIEFSKMVKFVDVDADEVFILNGDGSKVEASFATVKRNPNAKLCFEKFVSP